MPPESARRLLREASLELARLRRVRGAYRTTWRRIARARARLAFAAALIAAAPIAEAAAAGVPVFRHGLIFEEYASGGSLAPAFADIDGDGDLDVFTGTFGGISHFFANTGSAQLSAFAAPSTNPFGLADVGTNASPTFADLDGDGDLDALVGEGLGSTLFFRNTGTAFAPAFAAPLTNPFGLADVGDRAAPVVADLDGDGDLDVAVGNSVGEVHFFRNTGTASAPAFDTPATNPFGLADVGSSASPELTDLDGDGDFDAVVGALGSGGTASVFFFENTGGASDPAFAAPDVHPFGLVNIGLQTATAFADVDQDGDLDALASAIHTGSYTGIPVIIAFENTGTANAPAFDPAGNPFGLNPPLSFPFSGGTSLPAFGDIDADGDPDAFVGVQGGLSFSRNVGSPSLPAFARDPANPFGLVGNEPTLGDIDADGDPDVFVGTPSGDMVFFENTGTASFPGFAAGATNPFGLSGVGLYAAPELGDIDGDGDLDAFVGHVYGSTTFFDNTGTSATPAFAVPSTDPFGLTNVGLVASPNLADIDGDGDLDAFLGEVGGNVLFFRNTGSASVPAFSAPLANPFGLFDIGTHASPAFADYDGDGDLDAFIGRSSYFTAHFVNTGTANAPAFVGQGVDPFGNDGSFVTPDLGDIDGDGDLDALVGRLSDPNILLVRNFGTPGAPNLVPADATNPFGLSAGDPQLADIDGDGDLDAFVGQRFFRNTGTASAPAFAAPSTNAFGLGTVGAATFADGDGDGDLDAWIGTSAGNTLWLRNTGTATAPAFASPSTNPFGLADVGSNASPALGDLDLDGDLDAWIGNSVGTTLWFRNTGTANTPAFAVPVDNPFGFADVGRNAAPTFVDIDGDSDLDAFVGEARSRVLFFGNEGLGPEACRDGVDNDGDGRIDYSNDPGCTSPTDLFEISTRQCDNGLDDDGDSRVDWRGNGTGDPQCSSLTDNDELVGPQCDNGLDDDGDGKIDWRSDGTGDPECVGPLDDGEAPTPPSTGCGIGPELLLLGPLLAAERRRRRERGAHV